MPQTLLFKDVHIFDGETEIPRGDVLVEDGVIKKVSTTPLDLPNGSTTVIFKPGHTLIPGIIDAHIHTHMDGAIALTQSLEFGVTTVCDMHNEKENIPNLRKLGAEDADAADYKTASEGATIADGWPEAVVTAHDKSEETKAKIATWPKLKTRDDVEAYIEDRVRDKVDYIKLMHEDGHGMIVKPAVPSLELQKQIVEAAHAHGLIAVAHATSLRATIDMLEAGVDGLTHTFMDQTPTKELIAAYQKNNAYCNPTLVAMGSLTKQGLKEQEAYAHDPRVQKLLPQAAQERLCRCMGLGNESANAEHAYESVRQLKAAGIDIILGSDSAGPALGTAFGATIHQELATFVRKCGFTPLEALRAGTSLVAKRLGFPDRGRIAEGLRADLVLVEGNPLENIDRTLDLRGVWKQGVLCSAYTSVLA
ncbi:hypothetical protein SLS62_002949 [Diatrype stigma]|uniref:Amidohydrolase-related domain-containing protein n=1 Tax=Diatrype stigma TaxID=117547 RepID=A0AAN9YUT2_9PEZI